MLLFCQTCQCTKRSPVQTASLSHPIISYLSNSDNGKQICLFHTQLLFLLFLLSRWKHIRPHVDLSLRSKEVSRRKMQTHIMD